MSKGKFRKVSKKRVTSKRGKRVSHKKKVMKGGNPPSNLYEANNNILYFINGTVKYGKIITVGRKEYNVIRIQTGTLQKDLGETVKFKNVINMFDADIYSKMEEYGIDLKKIFEKGLDMEFKRTQ